MKADKAKIFTVMGMAVGLLLAGCRAPQQDDSRLRVIPGGALDSPARALDEVLRLRSSGAVPQNRQIVIEFACGTYAVERPLEITEAHGPLLLKGAGPLGTVFSGGTRLGAFKCELDGLTWRNAIDKTLNFDQLFINDRRADLSPKPNCFAPRAPGAWYLDTATHEVVYVARKGESTFTTIAIAGTADSILCLKGASDVAIEGIAFMHNALGRDGASGAMVVSVCSRRISLADCKFEHGSNYGMKIADSDDVTVRRSWFEDLGSGAVKADGTGRLVVEDNVVANSGRAEGRLAAVVVNGKDGCRVEHNDFVRLKGQGLKCFGSVQASQNRFWKVPGEDDSPRSGEAGVRKDGSGWRARVELLTF